MTWMPSSTSRGTSCSPGSNHTHAQPEGTGGQGGIGGRPPQARASGRQVTGDVADDQIVHRGEGDAILHR